MNKKDNLNENPFLKQTLAEIPKIDPKFYIDEFLRWLSEDYFETAQSNKIQVDYTIKHKDWPRLLDSKPKLSEWDPLTKEDNIFNLVKLENMGTRNISFEHLTFVTETLTTIKHNIESFITSYASFLQLTRLLEAPTDNMYSGEIILLNRLKDVIISRINSPSNQLIPKLYHFREHGCLMSVGLNIVIPLDIKTEEYIYEFGFSKTSSDTFSHALVEIIDDRLIELRGLDRPSGNNKLTSSYQWINMQKFHLVTELGKALKKEEFIDQETRMVDFRSVFEGTIKNPVNWIGESALSEILYLMYLLWEDERFKWVTRPKRPYIDLENSFFKNGKKFSHKYLVTDGNAKTIYSQIKNHKGLPTRAKSIENILVEISKK
jgi:hypothetical protein